MSFEAIREFQKQSFNHPWDQQTKLIDVWVEHSVKTPEEITGEYFCVYLEWLAKQLENNGSIYAFEEARYAISMAIVRESSPVDEEDVIIHHNLVFRLGDELEAVKYIPADFLRRLKKHRNLHTTDFFPRLTKDTYEEIYQRTPLDVLDRVSKLTFRGERAYRFSKTKSLSNVNYKLPYPGQDVLHAHYFDEQWPRSLA